MEENKNYIDIPKEKFEFANQGEKLADKKFDTKPVGYFKDALIRFSKNKASVVAAIIIVLIVLYAILVPLFMSSAKKNLMDPYYSKKGPRIVALKESLNIFNGGKSQEYSENAYIYELAKGVGAEFSEENGTVTLQEGIDSYYQPINKTYGSYISKQGSKSSTIYKTNIDSYLDVGFVYMDISQEKYAEIVNWEKENNKKILYPLIDTDSDYYFEAPDEASKANYWYKVLTTGNDKLTPVSTKNGTVTRLSYSTDLVLEDNYLRDSEGNLVYYKLSGGGTLETAQYRVRVLYYNYYIFTNGFEPEYILGTESQGYDLANRMANGIKLSLLLAVCVSVVNFILGALYGSVEGYYGGVLDLTLERVSDILSGIPFMVVATLFQMHLAKRVGAVPSLIFAFISTGWIGTASEVRTQFYRFKNQEYVMAARTLGASDKRIIWKHIFPNSLGTIITSSVLVIPGVIFSESMLSYLGIVNLGGSKFTSLGTLLSDSSSIWTKYPHLMIAPATIISLLMICFNLFGNGLRDAFNPQLRGVEE